MSRRIAMLVLMGSLAATARADEPVPAEAAWMRGTWTGQGYQEKTRSNWSVRLVVEREFAIEYPSLHCGGHWTFQRVDNAGVAWFVEHITYGRDRCVDGGSISIGRLDPRVLRYHWTGSGDVASATLTRQ